MCNGEQESTVSKLELDSEQLSKWLDDIIMKMNAEKCHLLKFGNKTRNTSVEVCATLSERFNIPLQIFLPSFSLLFCLWFVLFDVLLYSWFGHSI